MLSKEDALAECRRMGAEARAIGAAQDRTLANCRMMVRRWLKQSAAMLAEEHRLDAGFAGMVRARAERMLHTHATQCFR